MIGLVNFAAGFFKRANEPGQVGGRLFGIAPVAGDLRLNPVCKELVFVVLDGFQGRFLGLFPFSPDKEYFGAVSQELGTGRSLFQGRIECSQAGVWRARLQLGARRRGESRWRARRHPRT